MTKIRFPGSIKAMTEAQVMSIMALHTDYRRQKIAYQSETIAEPNPDDVFEVAMYEWKKRPLMTDKEFMNELLTLVNLDFPLVTTETVAAIYNLRRRWQDIPPYKDGKIYDYKDTSVRLQVRAARDVIRSGAVHTEHLLLPLTKEETTAVWGKPFPRTNWFRLADALTHRLGRWPSERKTEKKVKLAQGRPRKSEKEVQAAKAALEQRRTERLAARKAKQEAAATAREQVLQQQIEQLQAQLGEKERVPEGV